MGCRIPSGRGQARFGSSWKNRPFLAGSVRAWGCGGVAAQALHGPAARAGAGGGVQGAGCHMLAPPWFLWKQRSPGEAQGGPRQPGHWAPGFSAGPFLLNPKSLLRKNNNSYLIGQTCALDAKLWKEWEDLHIIFKRQTIAAQRKFYTNHAGPPWPLPLHTQTHEPAASGDLHSY